MLDLSICDPADRSPPIKITSGDLKLYQKFRLGGLLFCHTHKVYYKCQIFHFLHILFVFIENLHILLNFVFLATLKSSNICHYRVHTNKKGKSMSSSNWLEIKSKL